MMRDTSSTQFHASLNYLCLHSRSQLLEEAKTSTLISSQSSWSVWKKFCTLSQPGGLCKLMLNLFCKITNWQREFSFADYIKYTFNIVSHQTSMPMIWKLLWISGAFLYSFETWSGDACAHFISSVQCSRHRHYYGGFATKTKQKSMNKKRSYIC